MITKQYRRVTPWVATAILASGAVLLPGATAKASPAVSAASLRIQQVWSATLPDTGAPIAGSSPSAVTLDGHGPSVVVGDRAGYIWALHVSDGSRVPGWPASTGGVAVDSTPSSTGSTVFVGVGNSGRPSVGGYESLAANGVRRWFRTVPALPGSNTVAAIQGSLALGRLQGSTGVVSGALGQMEGAFNAGSGSALAGFPWFEADSNFSTPALADLYSNGRTEIVEGGDSTAGLAYGYQYTNGGHIRILSDSGALLCQHNTNQVVQSSPAVGRFLSGGAVGITVGTGKFYSGASNTNQLLAVDTHCNLKWASTLDGATQSSPALADALGNGQLQVAEGTDNGSGGSVWLLNGATGRPIWHVPALGEVMGGIVSADLGAGYQDLVVASTGGLQILDGRTGATVASLPGIGLQNSALVTHDPNGTVGITVAGYNSNNQGTVRHYEITGSPGSRVGTGRSWPSFHHDAHLSGNAGTPPPVIGVACRPPSTTPKGYLMTASDGGVFNFGNLPFCGSTGNLVLNRPVVGLASTPSGGGYWLVANDGGIFAFGNAHFYGSAGGLSLAQPIVAMARTPNGGGYWLVARDGGIFSYGDARFHGSTGNLRLTQPVNGMASNRLTGGYWLVASDGGIFAFDTPFYGSAGNVRLAQPIVGMASTPSGRGYWLVARDGGIFSYGDAHFYGSTGNIHLNQPIVGMAPTPDGRGYWLVARDGGIFSYGDAHFYGSTGNIHLTQPIVGMAAP